jgi:hypothetical protein
MRSVFAISLCLLTSVVSAFVLTRGPSLVRTEALSVHVKDFIDFTTVRRLETER